MILFFNRSQEEQDIIRNAYTFERDAILHDQEIDGNISWEPNPYYKAVLAMEEGVEVWEGINVALELEFRD